MRHRSLESVVLMHDLPEHRLKAGDLGAVVERHEPDGLEVEFVTGDGATQALVTLRESEVRPVEADEVIAVRRLRPTG
jgi:hypothetical protein